MSRWGEDQNFWPANAVKDGRSGPCGPCSEIFYDRGPEYGSPDETGPNTGRGDRFMEIWNLVFTQFDLADGELRPLPMQNIDTGMGFERLASVVTDATDAYATELFQPTIRRLVAASGVPYRDLESVPHRIVADHVRSVTMCIADGILPANDGAGYVIKMLIRRAARQAWQMGVRRPVLFELVAGVAESMGGAYPERPRGGRPHRRDRQGGGEPVPRDPGGRDRARQGRAGRPRRRGAGGRGRLRPVADLRLPARPDRRDGRRARRGRRPRGLRPRARGGADRVARRRRQGDDVRRRRRARRGRRGARAEPLRRLRDARRPTRRSSRW